MKRLIAILIAGLSTLPVAAHDFTAGTMFIDHPMIQEAPPSAPVLGGYIMLQNNGTTDDRLIGIESASVEKVELHQSVVVNDIASMKPMTEGLPVPAGAVVWLGDNGSHAMFIKPDRRYRDGDELPATLIFEQAGRIDVTFKVEKRTGDELAPGHHDMNAMSGAENGQ